MHWLIIIGVAIYFIGGFLEDYGSTIMMGIYIVVGIVVALFIWAFFEEKNQKATFISNLRGATTVKDFATTFNECFDKYITVDEEFDDEELKDALVEDNDDFKEIITKTLEDNERLDNLFIESLKNKENLTEFKRLFQIKSLTKYFNRIIKKNDLTNDISYRDKFLLIDNIGTIPAIEQSIQNTLSHNLKSLSIDDLDYSIDRVSSDKLKISIVQNVANYSSLELTEYITNNPNANILIGLAYLKSAHNDGIDIVENIDDYVNSNWNSYDALVFIENILPLNKILPKDEYRDIVKQKSNLIALHNQELKHQEQLNALNKVQKEQERTRAEVELNNQLQEESNRLSEESIKTTQESVRTQKDTQKYLKKTFG